MSDVVEFPSARSRRIKGDLLILDVKDGRESLLKRVSAGDKVKVYIVGSIDTVWSDDDGVSREFGVSIESINEFFEPDGSVSNWVQKPQP